MDKPSDRDSRRFIQLSGPLGFIQLVTQPTQVQGHILDIVLSRCAKLVLSVAVYNLHMSDHFLAAVGVYTLHMSDHFLAAVGVYNLHMSDHFLAAVGVELSRPRPPRKMKSH